MTGILDSHGRPARMSARPEPSGAFFQGERNMHLWSWRPALRDVNDDVQAAWRIGTARAVEALQNSGWLSGGVDEAVASLVGTGLRLNVKPDWEELGWTQESAQEWARRVERRFETWARNPIESDLTQQFTVHQQIIAACKLYYGTGALLARLPVRSRPFARTVTKLQMLHPAMICDRTDATRRLRNGVFLDADDAPVALLIKQKDVVTGIEQDVAMRLRDDYGRAAMIHVFDGLPGQVRGITPMAPVLKVVRQYDQLADATLTATLLQTLFAATLTSNPNLSAEAFAALQTTDDTTGNQVNALEAYMGMKGEWYKNTKLDLGVHGRIAHLFPGEQLEFKGAEHPSSVYGEFSAGLLREVARCLGITFEQLTGNYTQATYSSVRMATANMWQIVLTRRENLPGRVYQGVFEAWLEEDIAEGRTPCAVNGQEGLDAFLANRAALCRSDWRGPARPTADDQKTANAQKTKLTMGVTTLEAESAEYGMDWEDIAEQQKRERDTYKRLGLVHPVDAERGRGQNDIARGKDNSDPDSPDAPDDDKEKEAA